MKKPKIIGLTVIAAIILTLFSGLLINSAEAIGFTEQQITTNTAAQENPDLYVSDWRYPIIVWQDNRNGNWDIYMYDQQLDSWHPEIQITANSSNNINPRIFNNTIVYQSDRNGNWNIYMYNITSKVETQITNNSATKGIPEIDGNKKVWQDSRNGGSDIYMYNLTSQTESRVPLSGSNYCPSVSGNRIAYMKPVGYYGDMYAYCYDFSTGKEAQLAEISFYGKYTQTAIEGNYATWITLYDPHSINSANWVVEMKNVLTGAGWQSTNGGNHNPDVSGEGSYVYVVYDATIYGATHVYLYSMLDNQVFRVTNNNATQICPRISAVNNQIVYMDNRNGNWDIYSTWFGYGVSAIGPSPKPTSPPSGNNANSANQEPLIIIVSSTAIIVIAVVGAAAFTARKNRSSKKPNNYSTSK